MIPDCLLALFNIPTWLSFPFGGGGGGGGHGVVSVLAASSERRVDLVVRLFPRLSLVRLSMAIIILVQIGREGDDRLASAEIHIPHGVVEASSHVGRWQHRIS